MSFPFSQSFVDSGLTYSAYRQRIEESLTQPAPDEAAATLQAHIKRLAALMQQFEAAYQVNPALLAALDAAPATTWVVISEYWCGDATYSGPLLAALEKARPDKVQLRFFLRDSTPGLMEAYLTDGARSIPKVVVLSESLAELGTWGPRPAELQQLMHGWRSQQLPMQELIPKVQGWYDNDATQSVQRELQALVESYS